MFDSVSASFFISLRVPDLSLFGKRLEREGEIKKKKRKEERRTIQFRLPPRLSPPSISRPYKFFTLAKVSLLAIHREVELLSRLIISSDNSRRVVYYNHSPNASKCLT